MDPRSGQKQEATSTNIPVSSFFVFESKEDKFKTADEATQYFSSVFLISQHEKNNNVITKQTKHKDDKIVTFLDEKKRSHPSATFQIKYLLLRSQSKSDPDKFHFHLVDDLNQLGDGNFGKVMKGVCTFVSPVAQSVPAWGYRQTDYAVKICEFNPKRDTAEKEVAFMRLSGMRAKNVIQGKINNVTYNFIVMENLKGHDLFDLINKDWSNEQRFTTNMILKLIKSLLLAYHRQIYSQNIHHRDLKPENIKVLIDFKRELILSLRIFDFGLSKKSDEFDNAPCGSPMYIAPEVIDGTTGLLSDIYALGVIIKLICRDDCIGFNPKKTSLRDYVKLANSRTTLKFSQMDLTPDHQATLRTLIFSMLALNETDRFRDPQKHWMTFLSAVNVIDTILLERMLSTCNKNEVDAVRKADTSSQQLKCNLDELVTNNKQGKTSFSTLLTTLKKHVDTALGTLTDQPAVITQFIERLGDPAFAGETSKKTLQNRMDTLIETLTDFANKLEAMKMELSQLLQTKNPNAAIKKRTEKLLEKIKNLHPGLLDRLFSNRGFFEALIVYQHKFESLVAQCNQLLVDSKKDHDKKDSKQEISETPSSGKNTTTLFGASDTKKPVLPQPMAREEEAKTQKIGNFSTLSS